MSIKFSVVITTFNRPAELKEALDGVYAQIEQPLEVIVVNDASSLPYEEVISDFSDKPGFHYQYLNESSGANKARNIGVDAAVGDVIAFLDDDDIWLPDYLLEHKIAYNNGADAVVSGYQNLGKEEEVFIQPSERVELSVLRTGNQYCGMSGFSIRKHVALKERFDESLPNGQDWDMYVRLHQQGYELKNIPKSIFLYRFMNMDGIGAKVAKMTPEEAVIRLRSADKHKQFLGEDNYRKRVAAQLLVYLPLKRQKLKWVLTSLRLAGVRITFLHIVSVTSKKLRQRIGGQKKHVVVA